MKRWVWEVKYLRRPSWDLGTADPTLLTALDDHGLVAGRVLDIGGGTGDNDIALAQRGFEVTAVDISARAINLAREKARTVNSTARFEVTPINELKGIEGPFDLFVDRGCMHSLGSNRARAECSSARSKI